ncbi:MAG: phospholipase D-like domain-containing protein, partial [Planctomycetota bacterium]|nr:phospholipase D-like domain-containing protein [Planctomycetota bacterium]
VDVRVLVDGIGAHYSYPSILHLLRQRGVKAAKFLAPGGHLSFINLRNHRKIMVVDGITGFTGGMNIRESMVQNNGDRNRVKDLHFRIRGPVVAHLQEAFADDWHFCTGESLIGEQWFPNQDQCGEAIARGITDGPDEDLDKLRWALLAALSNAQRSIQIMTPYFLPDLPLITSLNLAAMRGVKVDIVLPEKCNLPFLMWATRSMLWQVLEHGCKVWLTPQPFDHSKLMLVDDCWTLIGSSNWDARTLRLNFEFNVEFYDHGFARQMREIVEARLGSAREVTLEEMDGRSLPIRLRDGTARLFAPYL